MNASLYTLDRVTHLKIVFVAAITVAVVLAVGESARLDRTASATPAPLAAQLLLQPTHQSFWGFAPSPRPLMPAAKPASARRATA